MIETASGSAGRGIESILSSFSEEAGTLQSKPGVAFLEFDFCMCPVMGEPPSRKSPNEAIEII